MNDKEDVPMIEKYKVETALVHTAKSRRAAVIVCILAALCIIGSIIGNVLIVEIFTSKYNARTKDWIDLAKELARGTAITEVADETATIQQYAPP